MQPNPSAESWRDEISRKLAEHRNRKATGDLAAVQPEQTATPASRAAADALARVTARYAKAPSYSEMQASEARAALRAAEVATLAALEAQQTAQAALRDLEAAAATAQVWEVKSSPRAVAATHTVHAFPEPAPTVDAGFAVVPEPVKDLVMGTVAVTRTDTSCEPIRDPFADEPQSFQQVFVEEHRIQDEPAAVLDLPQAVSESRFAESEPVSLPPHYAVRWEDALPTLSEPAANNHESTDSWWQAPSAEPIEVEAAQPIAANLIEFPREVVAPRRARPRLDDQQLSIFEVDPAAVVQNSDERLQQPQPEPWNGIQLGAQSEEALLPAEDPKRYVPEVEVVGMSRRALAAVVDATLIAGCTLAVSVQELSAMAQQPTLHAIEAQGGVTLAAVAAGYMVLGSVLFERTPGMRYAGVTLTTLEGQHPGMVQRLGRLGALALSAAPMGLGLVWGLFDEQHLSWHDRLSKTYLRRR